MSLGLLPPFPTLKHARFLQPKCAVSVLLHRLSQTGHGREADAHRQGYDGADDADCSDEVHRRRLTSPVAQQEEGTRPPAPNG